MQVAGVLLVLYSVVVAAIDWTRRLETIEKHWPKIARVVANRKLNTVILLVAVALLAAVYDKRQVKPPVPVRLPSPPTSGPAKTSGPESPANTGNGNTFNYNSPPQSAPKRSDAPKKD